jgi:hypothetical protein
MTDILFSISTIISLPISPNISGTMLVLQQKYMKYQHQNIWLKLSFYPNP